jgi:hypothetical protein
MTPSDLIAAGESLFGPKWRQSLADLLEVDAATLRRWATAKIAIPKPVALTLQMILRDRERDGKRRIVPEDRIKRLSIKVHVDDSLAAPEVMVRQQLMEEAGRELAKQLMHYQRVLIRRKMSRSMKPIRIYDFSVDIIVPERPPGTEDK